MKKRIVALALTMTMVVAALVGCGGSDKKETKAETKAAETTAATEARGKQLLKQQVTQNMRLF